MKPWTLLLPCLLAGAFPGVSARRGGGGSSSDSDSNGSGGGGNDGGGGDDSYNDDPVGDEHCGIPDIPPVWKWDLIPLHAQNNTGMKDVGLAYGGSFYLGEASLRYTVSAGRVCNLNDTKSARMLGYAWIGPQPSYPAGPTNPVIIGFKAWKTNMPLDRIGDSYTYIKKDQFCPRKPDLFLVTTTHGWTDFQARKTRAADFMNMQLLESDDNKGEVLFNATMPEALDFKPVDETALVSLPRDMCAYIKDYNFKIPDQLAMTGSFTNTTLNLILSGSGNATDPSDRDKEITAEYTVTFTGVFDSDNSTHKVSVHQQSKPLVTWEKNSAVRDIMISWSTGLVCIIGFLLLV